MDFLSEVLDLREFIKDPVRTLSLGQRMRADIAASLLHNPKAVSYTHLDVYKRQIYHTTQLSGEIH